MSRPPESRMADSAKEILYWQSSGGSRGDLVKSLEQQGYSVVVANRLEDVLDRFDDRKVKSLVVDAAESDHETSTRILELTSTERLFKTPLIFFGKGQDGTHSTLAKQFIHLASLSGESTIDEVLAQFDVLMSGRKVDRSNLRGALTSATINKLELSPQLDPARLVSSYGGSLFAAATRPSFFDDEPLLPKHSQRALIGDWLTQITRLSNDQGTRARRVTYLAGAIANGVGFSQGQDITVRTSSLVLAHVIYGEPSLSNLDFLHDEMEASAELVAAAVDRARQDAENELQDMQVCKTLGLFGDILRRRELFESADEIRVAHCLLLSEMAERACWKSGEWSPNGAHRIIREFRHQSRFNIDAQLVSGMVRLLTEASCARHAWKRPSEQRRRRAAMEMNKVLVAEARKEAEELFSDRPFSAIDLSDIRAGMRLARPFLTLEGRLVLRANVQLDESLIWGIWQLSTVAPLEKCIFVTK